MQPNYDIVISEGKLKQVHNLFFDRFAEKVADDVASIYKLSFKSIVNALDNGLAVNEIIEYLEKNSSNPLPDNVRNHIVKELPYTMEIDGRSSMKVKREIEKKNHFCIIE